MSLKYKCPECGTPLGFEGLCWRCRAKKHRDEVDNWTDKEIEEKINQVIKKLKVSTEDNFYKTDEYEIFQDLMTKGIYVEEFSKIAFEREIFYPDENYFREDIIDEMVNNRFVVSTKEKPLFYGAFTDDVNTIGEFGNWIQDWEYRECPECGKKMKYLAQIHWDTIMDSAEGTLYIEICPDCKIITMFHQQT